MFKSRIRQLMVPQGVVLAASGLLLSWNLRVWFASAAGEWIPMAISAAVVLLAWRFRSPRILLAIVLLLIAERILLLTTTGPILRSNHLTTALGVLLPVNLAVLLLVDELTFDIETFAWWSGLVVLQALVVAAINRPGQDFLLAWLELPFINSFSVPTAVSQTSLTVFIVVALMLLWTCFTTGKPTDIGLFWALCASFAALNTNKTFVANGYFATAALILGIAVIQKSYLFAYHDDLTGLPGRRSFNEALAALKSDFCIAMVDIDHFKQFNDTFGHAVGDQVLRMVAARLSQVAGGGHPFRCGGEEFAIVFRGRTVEEAFEYAEMVRKDIESSTFVVRGPDRSTRKRKERRRVPAKRSRRPRSADVQVTVSIGLAEPYRTLVTVEDVVRAADKALYLAKARGRNRVEVYASRHLRRSAYTR